MHIIALETTRLSDNIFETRLSSNIGTSNALHDNQEYQEMKCLRTSLIRTPLFSALRLRRSWNRCTQLTLLSQTPIAQDNEKTGTMHNCFYVNGNVCSELTETFNSKTFPKLMFCHGFVKLGLRELGSEVSMPNC